jgi:hypothetical protein
VGQGAAALHEQLQDIVEHRRIALRRRGDGPDSLQVLPKGVGVQVCRPGPHPVEVATERVDLSIVDDGAVGVGEPPRAQRVRGEARVDEGQRRLHPIVGQLRVVAGDLRIGQESLVDHPAPIQRTDVERLTVVEAAVRHRRFEETTQDVQPGVQGLGRKRLGGPDEELPHVGLRGAGRGAEVGGVGRHRAPRNRFKAFGPYLLIDEVAERRLDVLVGREKKLADPVGVRRTQARHDVLVERVGLLNQDTRPVPRVFFGAARPTVVQPAKQAERLVDHCVALRAVEVHKDPDATVGSLSPGA